MICRCKGCQNRAVGCHCFCPDYKLYRAELENQKKEANKDKDYIGYIAEVRRASKERKRRHGVIKG